MELTDDGNATENNSGYSVKHCNNPFDVLDYVSHITCCWRMEMEEQVAY